MYQPKLTYGKDGDDTECPICLEIIPPMKKWDEYVIERTSCCGKSYCSKCDEDFRRRRMDVAIELKRVLNDPMENKFKAPPLLNEFEMLMKCPFCREQIPKNDLEKFHHHLKRANAGDSHAEFSVGMAYMSGEDVELDHSKAIFWLKKAAEHGSASAMYMYGFELFGRKKNLTKKTKLEAFSWMEKAANEGYAPAECYMGLAYYSGEGVKKNWKKALHFLKLSADQGFPRAAAKLGSCYSKGEGVKKDAEKALQYFRSAAEEGDAMAQHEMGTYYEGKGDFEQSIHWCSKSAENGYHHSILKLGNLLVRETLLQFENKEEITFRPPGSCTLPAGIKWLRLALALGHFSAIETVTNLETFCSTQCANCNKRKPQNANLMRCSQCRLISYCSKHCQVAHWKAGHKVDCRSQNLKEALARCAKMKC